MNLMTKENSTTAYCVVCRSKVILQPPIERRHTKHNRFLYIGHCPQCKRKVSIIRQERSE
jgi:hypothetical protein